MGLLNQKTDLVLLNYLIILSHLKNLFLLGNTSVRSRARFREFVHTLGRVVAKPTHQRVCAVATRRNTQN